MSTQYVVAEYTPREHQVGMHTGMENHRWSVIVAHRRFGKTVCVVNHLIKMATLCKESRPQFAYLAPTYAQAKKVSWEYIKHYCSRFPDIKINESELWVRLPNNAKIMLAGADNPDSLRGIYLDGVVLDEVAQMKPHAWREVIRPTLSDRRGWAVFIGTPKGVNMFYDIWVEAQDNDAWYSAMFKASETELISQDDLANAHQTMGSSQFAQEYECDWTAKNEDVVISYDEVEGAFLRSYPPDIYRHRPIVFGVDPARFGDDRTALVVRQGLQVITLETWANCDTMETASNVSRFISQFKPEAVFIDSVGVGAGVVDRLHQLGHDIISVNGKKRPQAFERYANARAEMWFRVKAWLQAGGALPRNDELKTDLLSPTYSFDARNRMLLEGKESMRRRGVKSPDLSDALALTFFTEIHGTRWDGAATHMANMDYDPFGEIDYQDKRDEEYIKDVWRQ